jgi:hypothetical protein
LKQRPGATDGKLPAWMPVGEATGTEALGAYEAQQETDYGLLLERVTAVVGVPTAPPAVVTALSPGGMLRLV